MRKPKRPRVREPTPPESSPLHPAPPKRSARLLSKGVRRPGSREAAWTLQYDEIMHDACGLSALATSAQLSCMSSLDYVVALACAESAQPAAHQKDAADGYGDTPQGPAQLDATDIKPEVKRRRVDNGGRLNEEEASKLPPPPGLAVPPSLSKQASDCYLLTCASPTPHCLRPSEPISGTCDGRACDHCRFPTDLVIVHCVLLPGRWGAMRR